MIRCHRSTPLNYVGNDNLVEKKNGINNNAAVKQASIHMLLLHIHQGVKIDFRSQLEALPNLLQVRQTRS